MDEGQGPDVEAPERRPFAAFLQEHRHGGLHGELSDGLAELVAAAREHDKSGTLTLTVKVAPNKDGLTVTVTDDVKVKAPEADRGAALYFADERGNLSRRNPQQMELPLREVPAPERAEARALDTRDGTT
jgi:hypothetical protein